MRKDCDDATLVRVDLERKIETMVEEMEFLKKIHSDVRNKIEKKFRFIQDYAYSKIYLNPFCSKTNLWPMRNIE